MKILMLLTNAFDPDPRVFKEALSLAAGGHEVEIFCWDRESRYKERSEETVEGIRIIRHFSGGSYGSGLRQVSGFISYARAAGRYAAKTAPGAVHCHDFDTLIIGYRIRKHRNIRLIFDEHDLFHLYFSNRSGFINRMVARWIVRQQRKFLRIADAHIVVTPAMKAQYPADPKVMVVTNAPLKSSFKNPGKKKAGGMPVIGFVGTIRYFDELKTLLEESAAFPDIGILIAGKGRALQSLRDFLSDHPSPNVTVSGGFTLEELEEIYAGIDVTYLIYPGEDSKISLPNKFFESIITETPIIADSRAEYGQLVRSLQIGWTVDRERLREGLRETLNEISRNPDAIERYRATMRKIKHEYYWESNIPILLGIYRSVDKMKNETV